MNNTQRQPNGVIQPIFPNAGSWQLEAFPPHSARRLIKTNIFIFTLYFLSLIFDF